MRLQCLKFVLVGNWSVGKSCMIMSCMSAEWDEYIPSIMEAEINKVVDDLPVVINLFEAASHEEYDRLRPLIYPQSDALLVCFSLIDRDSFEHARSKWLPEVKYFCGDASVILVGTKLDLRDDKETVEQLQLQGTSPISYEEGIELAEELGAARYVECSGWTRQGLDKVLEAAVRDSYSRLKQKKKKLHKCNIS